jgi:hypothetical protein
LICRDFDNASGAIDSSLDLCLSLNTFDWLSDGAADEPFSGSLANSTADNASNFGNIEKDDCS